MRIPLKQIFQVFHISLFFLSACTAIDLDSEFKKTSEDLRSKTIPPYSKIIDVSPVKRTSSNATLVWEFETDWNQETYDLWLSTQLQSQFILSKKENLNQDWKRVLPGDIYTLQIRKLNFERALRIQIIFTASVF